ncbi:MAG TPA: glycosyltransferase [Bacteroidia bacterium]|nr:glycosyltransferase [Bacteroidia bacterium]
MPVHSYYKILFIPKWYPNRTNKFSGIFIEKHAKALAKECRVAVLYVGADENLKTQYESDVQNENNITTVRVYYQNNDVSTSLFGKAIKFYRYLFAAYLGLKCIKAEFGKPNLVHVNVLTRPGIIAWLLYKLNGIPYIISEHWSGYLPADGSYKGSIKKMLTRLIVKNAKAITAVSQKLAVSMQSHKLTGSYTIIPNCIELEKIPNRTISEFTTAVMVGNLFDKEKNISAVIHAVAALKTAFPDFKLTIIGGGEDELKLKQLIVDLGITNQIIFKGILPQIEVYKELCAASFLICNSNYETFSVVIAEALACGTPVLATRCGGPEEFVTEQFGKLIPLHQPEELKNGIAYMLQHHASFSSQKMMDYARTSFNPDTIAQQFISIYNPFISKWEAGNTRELLSIPHNWRVLDVGSGDHPNERADVLLEREIEATEHRSGAKAVIPLGKKLILGDATEMPFMDKEFDFVIASHIAEHIDEPEKFCSELQRVAKAGYIETPGAFSEFIFNEAFHKWVVSNKNGVLVFTEKTKHTVFSEWFYRLYYLNEKRSGHKALYSKAKVLIAFVNLIRKTWKYLPKTYTCFHWQTSFKYTVIRKSTND